MAIYYAVGDALITADELSDKAMDIAMFEGRMRKRETPASVRFSTGVLDESTFDLMSAPADGAQPTPFTNLEVGKPLAIEIRQLYTGHHPLKRGFSRAKDLLVTTAVKALPEYSPGVRAVNYLTKIQSSHRAVDTFAATDPGTPVVYYSPGITSDSLVVTVELSFDDFPEKFFEQVGNILSSAGKLPVFATASSYLLGAGIVMKLFASIGNAFGDSRPEFSHSERITLFRPGESVTKAGFVLFVPDDIEQRDLREYRIDQGRLVDSGGNPYRGDHPYVVLSYDGAKRDGLKDFVPTKASAEILHRFLNIREGGEQPIDVILKGAELYNDMYFRRQALEGIEALKSLDPKSEEAKQLVKRVSGFIDNIKTTELRPQKPGGSGG